MELTKSELEIMNVIWDAKRPLTRGEILDLSVDKKWKDNSIHILLNRLLEKGAIIEGGFARSGKSYGRLYEPNITGVDFYAENVLSGGDQERLEMLFDALLKRPDIDADMIKKFESKLEEKKKESLENRRATMEKKKAAAAESQRIRDLIMNPGEWPPSGSATPSQIAATRAAYNLENGYIERREKSSAINERLAALRESIERKG